MAEEWISYFQRRLSLVGARNKYTYIFQGIRKVCCNTHSEQDALTVELPDNLGRRYVCPICFRVDIGPTLAMPVKRSSSLILVDQTYSCMEENCKEVTNYHGQCAFCRDYFCNEHLDRNQCCAACLSQLEGVISHESLRGS